jgi:NAD(P)-dependent dehydrogenase (short-subunit alcohol dehydrogenase family)
MLALAYRQEVAHLGITVGLVHPSWIDTDLVRGAEADLPSFQEFRARLPYPGNVTTSVDRAAAAIVRGLARRRSRVYVPRSVVVANWGEGRAELAGRMALDEALRRPRHSDPRA